MDFARRLHAVKPSYIRGILSAASADGVISLAGGLPAPELLPLSLLEQAMAGLSQTPDLFQYGETQGYAPLLEHLEHTWQLPADHRALICTGSQQGIDLIARAYLNPGDGVVLETPGYVGALQTFALAQARIETIKQQSDGPDLQALKALFATGTVKLFYAVPDFHNPTGTCWTLPVRRQVANLCRRYRIALLEDAPYRDLRFTGQALPLVSSLCPEQALVLRSFSKISAPGMRLGAVTGLQHWLAPIITVKQASDLHTALPVQAMLLALLRHKAFPQHIANVRKQYGERYRLLTAALTEQSTGDFTIAPVEGGMFIWLRLNAGQPVAIARAAMEEGVAVVPGHAFYPDPNRAEPALRLNFSHARPELLIEAAYRLRRAIERTPIKTV